MENFGKFTMIIIMLITSTIMVGFTFSYLWEWLIAPIWNLELLTIKECIGISFAIKFFFVDRKNEENDENFMNKISNSFIFTIFWCLITLLSSYILISI